MTDTELYKFSIMQMIMRSDGTYTNAKCLLHCVHVGLTHKRNLHSKHQRVGIKLCHRSKSRLHTYLPKAHPVAIYKLEQKKV